MATKKTIMMANTLGLLLFVGAMSSSPVYAGEVLKNLSHTIHQTRRVMQQGRRLRQDAQQLMGNGQNSAVGNRQGSGDAPAQDRRYRVEPQREPSSHAQASPPAARKERLARDEVRELQSLLNTVGQQYGVTAGVADGKVRPSTRRAIEAFQQAYRLPVDGEPTALVLNKVRQVHANSRQVSERPRDHVEARPQQPNKKSGEHAQPSPAQCRSYAEELQRELQVRSEGRAYVPCWEEVQADGTRVINGKEHMRLIREAMGMMFGFGGGGSGSAPADDVDAKRRASEGFEQQMQDHNRRMNDMLNKSWGASSSP